MTPEDQAALSALRRLAIAAGQRLNAARIDGKRMREIWTLEREHVNAWRLVYSYEAMERAA